MTAEELQKLKDAVTEAEAAAKAAADDVIANPTDEQKLAAKVEADAKLEQAKKALAAAELQGRDTSAEIQAYKGRVILLTFYLLAVVLFSIYLLAGFFMAETDPVKVNKQRKEDKCCAEIANANGASRKVADTNANVNSSNANTSNANLSNANLTRANVNANANTANSNTGADVNTAVTNAGTTEGDSPTETGAGTTDTRDSDDERANGTNPQATQTPDPAIPEMSIPKEVYVRFPGLSTGGVWSAESYLFLIVFLAGMLGGTIRALHSLVKHLGLKDFSFYWSWFYITLPFTSAGLAIVIYFVLRGGFYGGGFGKGLVLNIFSFAALAALTGLFTDNAMERLKQAAGTMLAPVPDKVDNAGEIQAKKEAENKTE
jgi:hypothetical protein